MGVLHARPFVRSCASRPRARHGRAYRIVRHPLYTAYLVGGIGYLMQSLSTWNIVIDAVAVGWQVVRIRAEERHLSSPAYDAYRARVPWRLIPRIW